VLFRTNAQARPLALSLRAAGVPFRVRADADLFGAAEVRDVVAYLRLAHSPTGSAALGRVINVPSRRLGAIEQAFRKRPVPVAELPSWAHKRGGPHARRTVEEFLGMLRELHQSTLDCRPVEALEMVLERTGYVAWLSNQKDGTSRIKRVQDLHEVMTNSHAPDLATWLIDMHLEDVESSSARTSSAVVLSTIHAAKGNEWAVVFVVGFEDGLIPHVRPAQVGESHCGEDEERRLAYVAFSRSQVLLYLVHCQARRIQRDGSPGRLEPRRVSRFLSSLPPKLLEPVVRPRVA
jgi:DNA helicase-2/ATP-dependent DNA helicase PcrA